MSYAAVRGGAPAVEEMTKVTASEIGKKAGQIHRLARNNPVAVEWHGMIEFVILPVDTYRRLQKRDRVSLLKDDMNDVQRRMLSLAEPAIEGREFNDEYTNHAESG